VSEASREYGVGRNLIHNWRRQEAVSVLGATVRFTPVAVEPVRRRGGTIEIELGWRRPSAQALKPVRPDDATNKRNAQQNPQPFSPGKKVPVNAAALNIDQISHSYATSPLTTGCHVLLRAAMTPVTPDEIVALGYFPTNSGRRTVHKAAKAVAHIAATARD
jgi:hypothetical protein